MDALWLQLQVSQIKEKENEHCRMRQIKALNGQTKKNNRKSSGALLSATKRMSCSQFGLESVSDDGASNTPFKRSFREVIESRHAVSRCTADPLRLFDLCIGSWRRLCSSRIKRNLLLNDETQFGISRILQNRLRLAHRRNTSPNGWP